MNTSTSSTFLFLLTNRSTWTVGWLQELLPNLDEQLHLHHVGHLAPHLGGPAHKLVFYLDDWWLVLQKYSGSGLGYKDNHHLCVQDDTQEDCMEELYWRKILLGMQDFFS